MKDDCYGTCPKCGETGWCRYKGKARIFKSGPGSDTYKVSLFKCKNRGKKFGFELVNGVVNPRNKNSEEDNDWKKSRKYWTKRMMILLSFITLLILMSVLRGSVSIALSRSQRNTADAIADICIEEHPTYGILPSVAIGQAFVESGLGSGGSNLFGVNGCFGLETVLATYRYLQCLHNEFFKGKAAWKDSPEEQLYYILERGYYCEGEYPYGRYYNNVIQSIYRYGWDKYDEKLSRKIAEKDRERARKIASRLRAQRTRMPFRLIFNKDMALGTMCADPEYIKKGSTVILGYYIFEVTESDKSLDNSVIIGCKDETLPSLHDDIFVDGFYTYLTEVIEDAKG